MVNLIPFIHLDSGWEEYGSACMKEPGGSQPPSLSSPHTALGSMLIILDAQPLASLKVVAECFQTVQRASAHKFEQSAIEKFHKGIVREEQELFLLRLAA
ncbi:unnamed protein product [Clonostachys byssicola]|uniref:Uncharacterized protein n=1 Tax=Clonostachys byssicola TaxID=160290 RepID=A0A9N9UKL0_9HYPO|nr:unnamed protein product [Clonostachys byssicola]